ncbi:glycosyltransferase [candidate division KSB1 bacterium]
MIRDGKKPLFSIIIITSHRHTFIEPFIDPFRSITDYPCEILVVFDRNAAAAEDMEIHDAVFIERSGSAYSVSMNRALRRVRGSYCMIADERLRLPESWAETCFEDFRKHDAPDLLMFGQELEDGIHTESSKVSLTHVGFIMKREVLDTIGGFDERFSLRETALEDFFRRAQNAKLRVASAGTAVLREKAVTGEEEIRADRKKFSAKWNVEARTLRDAETKLNDVIAAGLSKEECSSMLIEANRLVVDERYEEGLRLYDTILGSRPNFIEALHNKSAVLYQTGNKKEGTEGLERVIRIDPAFAETYCTLGLVREEEGEHDAALEFYRKCIARDIENDKAYEGYRRIAEKTGRSPVVEQTDFVFYTSGIMFDGATIHSRGLGGSESALYYIAKHLAAAGYTVRVFNNCEQPGTYEGVEYRDMVDFFIFNRWNSASVFISSRSFKPLFFNVNAKVKVIWLHDMPNVAYLDDYDFNALNLPEIRFFTLSEFQTDAWQDFLGIGRDHFYITRNGFDPAKFRSRDRRRKRHKLMYSSRPVRGLEILLKVFPEIKKAVPEAELHLFTYALSEYDNEIKPYLGALDQPGVFLRGTVPQEELAEEMAESRLLLYPSIFKETSCIAAIQAQASGLPVVTSRVGALPETIEDGVGGIIVDGDPYSRDYQDRFIEEAVRLMQDDSAWQRLSDGARDRMLKIYTWEKIAQEWLNFFESLPDSGIDAQSDSFPKKPRLSLCMIVKDEEHTLPKCLNSVKDIVDEIIVVDTGSTDRTVEVAREYGAIVRHFEWVDDFSSARNESLKHATGDWILYLDADEMVHPDHARRIHEVIERNDIMAVSMIEHIPQQEGNLFTTTASDYCRLFRNDPALAFTGRVHEQILPSINAVGGKVLKTSIRIDHWGFGLTGEKKKAREVRNLRLLKKELEGNPDDLFHHFNIGLTYASAGDKHKALEFLMRAVSSGDDTMKDSIRSTAHSTIAQLHFRDEQFDLSRQHAESAIELDNGNLLARYILSAIEFHYEQFGNAEKILEETLTYIESHESLPELNKAQLYIDLGNCAYKMNNIEKAIDRYKKAELLNPGLFELLFNLGTCYLSRKDYLNAANYFERARKTASDTDLIDEILDEIAKISGSQDQRDD